MLEFAFKIENTNYAGIKVRIYKPKQLDTTNPNPFMVYYHGGYEKDKLFII